MAEPDKQQIGEGSDSYGSAARNAGKAIRQAGQNAAKGSAQKGAEAAANAAAHTIKAGAKVGKAASEIAAGTAVTRFSTSDTYPVFRFSCLPESTE